MFSLCSGCLLRRAILGQNCTLGGGSDHRFLEAVRRGEQIFARRGCRLQIKELAKMSNEVGFHLGRRDAAVKEFFQRGGFAFSDAAGNDEVEITQVGGHVVRKTVRSNPAADVYADGGKFFFGHVRVRSTRRRRATATALRRLPPE